MKKWLFVPFLFALLTGCSYFEEPTIDGYISSKSYETGASIQIYDEFMKEMESKSSDKKKYKELLSTLTVQYQIQKQYYDKIRDEKVKEGEKEAKKIMVSYFDQKLDSIHLLKAALESSEVDTVKNAIATSKIKEKESQSKTLSDLNVLLEEKELTEKKTLSPEKKKEKKK